MPVHALANLGRYMAADARASILRTATVMILVLLGHTVIMASPESARAHSGGAHPIAAALVDQMADHGAEQQRAGTRETVSHAAATTGS